MKESIVGSEFTLEIAVTSDMSAKLDGIEIHPVYSTFWLVYHAEVAARKAIEPYLLEHEQAAGIGICLDHLAMAAIGETVSITAKVVQFDQKRILCAIDAVVKDTNIVISKGTQSQILTTQAKINSAIETAYNRLKRSH